MKQQCSRCKQQIATPVNVYVTLGAFAIEGNVCEGCGNGLARWLYPEHTGLVRPVQQSTGHSKGPCE